jgi:hypothetical protein
MVTFIASLILLVSLSFSWILEQCKPNKMIPYKDGRLILRNLGKCCKEQGNLICLRPVTMDGHICDWMDDEMVVKQDFLIGMLRQYYERAFDKEEPKRIIQQVIKKYYWSMSLEDITNPKQP